MIDELIERVEKGEGADRELDWDVACALGETPEHSVREIGFDYDWFRRPDDFVLWKATDSEGRSMSLWAPAKLTASLDAVLALIEEKLPGWAGDVDLGASTNDDGLYGARLFPPDDRTGDRFGFNVASEAKTPARALLAAYLRAHKEQHDG